MNGEVIILRVSLLLEQCSPLLWEQCIGNVTIFAQISIKSDYFELLFCVRDAL